MWMQCAGERKRLERRWRNCREKEEEEEKHKGRTDISRPFSPDEAVCIVYYITKFADDTKLGGKSWCVED